MNLVIEKLKDIFTKGSPPQICDKLKLPEGINVLVLAPHPDDFDAIGITLKKFQECGSQISLAVISGAASGVEDSFMVDYPGKTKAEVREKEQIESGLFFGLARDNISFLHLREDENGDPIEDTGNFQLIKNHIVKINPDIIFLPHGNDTNQGHVRTYRMCSDSIGEIGNPAMLFLNRDPKTIEMKNDLYIVFDKKEAAWKAELLIHHQSQHQRNLNNRKHGFDERVLAVNREIAKELTGSYEYAEVFEIEERAEQTLSAPSINTEAEQTLSSPGGKTEERTKPGSADRLVGIKKAKEWYNRGYLPHRNKSGLLQMITYRLADSLPEEVLTRLNNEIKLLPSEKQDPAKRKKIETWIDAGHGSCILQNPQIAELVIENWKHYSNDRYDLIAYVVMPNHVHVLIRDYGIVSLSKIVQAWKGYTGKKIKELLKNARSADRTVGIQERNAEQTLSAPSINTEAEQTLSAPSINTEAEQTLSAPSINTEAEQTLSAPGLYTSIWHREYWDRYIRDEEHFCSAVEYILENPVKARLVKTVGEWSFSCFIGT